MIAPRWLLRADASHRLGGGHVLRLAALAEAAVEAGGAAHLVVGGSPAASVAGLTARGLAATALAATTASADDLDATLGAARALAATAVIVDGPDLTAAYVAGLAEAGLAVVSVDDLGVAPLPTAAVINHNLGAEELAARYPAATHRLLGRRFHLLRREFRALPAGGPPLGPEVERVAVTMGASDPAGATARVLAALPAGRLEILVVLGPDFRTDRALTEAASACEARGHRLELASRPADLAARLAACDLAISSAGGTLAELAYLGRPTVAIAIAPDQVANARRHAAAGLVAGGWPLAELTDAALADELRALIADPDRRRALARRGAATTDGRGAARVVAALTA